MKALIIPGNPPSAHHYFEFRQELKRTNLFEAVEYLSYPSFDPKQDSESYISQCINYYRDYIESNGPFFLIGHSFGGFITSQLTNASNAVLIFPFLGRPGLRGKITLFCASWFLRLMPRSWQPKYQAVASFFSKEVGHLTSKEFVCILTCLFCSVLMRTNIISGVRL